MERQQEELKRRFNYEAWRHQQSAPEEQRRIRDISLTGIELPDWTPQRIQRMTSKDFPPYVRSIWQRRDTGTESLIHVDLYECDSIEAAREFLLRLLGEFQSNKIERREGTLGDVTFVYAGLTMVLFSRTNVVVWLRNAGPEAVPVTSLAQAFDMYLLSLLAR